MIRSLYRGDCLDILDNYIEPESVDLVYLDPPFNSQSIYNLPFKGKDKTHKPVEAFKDTWTWRDKADEYGFSDNDRLEMLRSNLKLQDLAFLVDFARKQDTQKNSMGAYILSMIWRLQAIHKVLKDTGSIYLHCDPTADHFLRIVMDCVFGRDNFRNQIIWHYGKWTNNIKSFQRNHDVLLFYSKTQNYHFNRQYQVSYDKQRKLETGWQINHPGGIKQLIVYNKRKAQKKIDEGGYDTIIYQPDIPTVNMHATWHDINILNSQAHERLGYATQKPLALLTRIIRASSNPEDIILDPYCGCGTAVHAAEDIGRQWIGIDISRFSVGLINHRILYNFRGVLSQSDIELSGLPETVEDARNLAESDRFEFEKWACGKIGANGMAQRIGERGPDGGIDGVIEFGAIQNRKEKKQHAIVQVKSGRVSADSVRALYAVVKRTKSVAGIMVCFEERMQTVRNQQGTEVWSDDHGTYPVIQGLSVERLLKGEKPILPWYGIRPKGQLTMF